MERKIKRLLLLSNQFKANAAPIGDADALRPLATIMPQPNRWATCGLCDSACVILLREERMEGGEPDLRHLREMAVAASFPT